MLGNNKLVLNVETMMKALQHYFDTVLFVAGKSPTVTTIVKSTGYDASTFDVGVSDPVPLITPTSKPLQTAEEILRDLQKQPRDFQWPIQLDGGSICAITGESNG